MRSMAVVLACMFAVILATAGVGAPAAEGPAAGARWDGVTGSMACADWTCILLTDPQAEHEFPTPDRVEAVRFTLTWLAGADRMGLVVASDDGEWSRQGARDVTIEAPVGTHFTVRVTDTSPFTGTGVRPAVPFQVDMTFL